MANDGIARLISVTQMKSNSANDDALNGADKQRGLLKEQKLVRDQLRAFDDKVKDKKVTTDELDQIRDMLAQAGLDTGSSSLGGPTIGDRKSACVAAHAAITPTTTQNPPSSSSSAQLRVTIPLRYSM